MYLYRAAVCAFLALALLSLILPSIPESIAQKEWIVDNSGPADYDTIQKAVNVASDGDAVLVMPGTYNSTQVDKKIDLIGQVSAGKTSFAVRISSLGVTKDASGASFQSFYAPNITASSGSHDLRFVGVRGAYSISNSRNVQVSSGAGSITATNVTNFKVDNFNGVLQGTLLNHTAYSDSSGGYTLTGDNLDLSGISGVGTITGNHVNITSSVGQLSVNGHSLELTNSHFSSLSVAGGHNSTLSGSKFTGPVTIGGKNLNFSFNEVNFGSLTVGSDSANTTVTNNRFLNSTVSLQAPGIVFDHNTVSNPFTNKSQTLPSPGSVYDVDVGSGAFQLTFTNNDVSGLEGVHISSCPTLVKDNYIRWAGFRPYINDTLLVTQQGMDTTGLKLGDAGISCTTPTNVIVNTTVTLNKIAGFYNGVSIAYDRSSFETNEVGANHTNIWVTGSNNTIIRNNFLGNASARDDGGSNKWYESSGATGTGNYWKAWADSNANEIGGLSRALALDGTGSTAVDKYPLARPVPLLEQTVVPEFSSASSMLLTVGLAGAISAGVLMTRKLSGKQA